ncbi:MAG: hypothetical protein ACYDB1_00595 [Acidiferrobacteraceae bacterium]
MKKKRKRYRRYRAEEVKTRTKRHAVEQVIPLYQGDRADWMVYAHAGRGHVMKAGPTPHIRMSPQDAMGCIDVAEKLGVNIDGMSFAMVVKLAVASLLESARQNGLIPRREGWEYDKMMSRFDELQQGARAGKLQMTALVQGMGSDLAPRAVMPETPERERRRMRYKELKFLHESDPLNHPLPQLGTPEHAEWEQLVGEFFDEG